jgi:hypothetical protein
MKLFGKFLLGILTFSALIAGVAYTIWMKPNLVLTESRVYSLFDHYAGSYFSKRPENLKLSLDPYGFTGKRLSLTASNFCMKDPIEACFKEVKIGLAFKFVKLTKIKIHELGPILVLNESLTYSLPLKPANIAPTPTPTPSSFVLTDHVEMPINIIIKDIHLDFPALKLINGKEIVNGRFVAIGKESDKMDLEASATSNEGLEGSLGLHTSFVLNQENPFRSKLHFKKSPGSIDGDLTGNIEWSRLTGNIEGGLAVKRFIPWIHTLYVKKLKLARKDKINLSAELETKLDQEIGLDGSKSVLPKIKLGTHLTGKIEAEAEKGSVHYKLEMGPTKDKGITLEAKAGGVFPFPKGEEYRYGIEKFMLKLDIPIFQNLVQSLKRTNYAVPAPFSIMTGNVTLNVGEPDGALNKNSIPVSFVTNLDSKEQTVKTHSKGQVIFAPKPKKLKVSGETKVDSIRITLPDLKVLEPTPLVKNDPRLISPHQEKKAAEALARKESGVPASFPIDLEWKLSTAPEGIRIYHPILRPYAPIEATWNISENSSGSVELKPFEIEYLNRIAKVEALRFYQRPGDSKFHYEGKLAIVKTDYTIFINIVQDGEKPKIVMSSDPPLDQGDIISVLLFNQTSAQLDTDQTSSVASTQSAITSRALGLFSILALSSTPVEAVNFNPATGIYSARVKLANGLTATVGTDWDKSQEVALRKRLGKNFVLSTILQSDPVTNSETRKTLIEWFRRF